MAESYLNLLLAFLMRKEIRASTSIREETLRRKWRSKIERLHVDCLEVPNPANLGDVRLREATKMFEIRNRIAHSYPDPKDMVVGKMWFLDCFPVLETNENYVSFTTVGHNQLPSPDEARFCRAAATALIEYLNGLLSDKVRDMIVFGSGAIPTLRLQQSQTDLQRPIRKTGAYALAGRINC